MPKSGKMDFHCFRHSFFRKLLPQYKPGDKARIPGRTDRPLVFLWPGRGAKKVNKFIKFSKGYAKYKYVFLNLEVSKLEFIQEYSNFTYYATEQELIPDQIWEWDDYSKIWKRMS